MSRESFWVSISAMQGYLVSAPLPYERLVKWLAERASSAQLGTPTCAAHGVDLGNNGQGNALG